MGKGRKSITNRDATVTRRALLQRASATLAAASLPAVGPAVGRAAELTSPAMTRLSDYMSDA